MSDFQPPMFKELDIETASSCNRVCPSCLRNTTDPAKLAERLNPKPTLMPSHLVYRIIDEAAEMGFTGLVNLSHFNEPLQDERLPLFGAYAKSKGVFEAVMFHTNADLLTYRRAQRLDGEFDAITVALYDKNTDENQRRISGMFAKTRIGFTPGVHIITHYSPDSSLQNWVEQVKGQPCRRGAQRRMILDYRGEMLMCCEDVGAYPSLGNIKNSTLAELWYSEKHVKIMADLNESGGRAGYGYCLICPRADEEN